MDWNQELKRDVVIPMQSYPRRQKESSDSEQAKQSHNTSHK